MKQLPIAAALPELLAALKQCGAAVLVAPPGAGKSTVVPLALLDAGLLGAGRLVMLQPRRVAARAVARRMAQVTGTPLGATIGYRVRFDDATSAQTRIEVITEGLLTRRLQSDPFLEGISCVVLDEFHERSQHADLALALLAELRREVRPDLLVLVMSATLDPEPIAAFLSPCAVVRSLGRAFPVEVRHDESYSTADLSERAAAAVRASLSIASVGHVLVFLPGKFEIEATRRLLEPASEGVVIRPLHGGLSAELQDQALLPEAETRLRKIVLSTNVAETSVTIDGVTVVIDSGQAKIPIFDGQLGLTRLERVRISKASAEQRAGRAGRTGPGLCLRLYSAATYASMAQAEEPELLRSDLARLALELRGWGTSPETFAFFQRPPSALIDRALAVLRQLGALVDGGLTPLGRTLLALPLEPRLGAVVASGHRRGILRAAATAAALLSEREILRDVPDVSADSDLTLRLEALNALEASRFREDLARRLGVDLRAARDVCAVRDQLTSIARRVLGPSPESSMAGSIADLEVACLRALLDGFGDRVAQRRQPRGTKFKLAGGGGATLDRKSVVHEAPLILAVALDAAGHGRGGEHVIRLASAVQEAWLPVVTHVVTRFDPAREAVVQSRERRFMELVLGEAPVGDAADATAVSTALALAASAAPERAFDLTSAQGFLDRIRCLAMWIPELLLPTFDELTTPLAPPTDLITDLCQGRRSFADLRKLNLETQLEARLTHAHREALNRHAPTALSLPAGRSGRLTYRPGEAPILAARIQHFFGLDQTPTVANGRVRVLLHLLAPNGRPAQVTQDLHGFWRSSWSLVRRDLRGRYPKHAWPEDPSAAWRED